MRLGTFWSGRHSPAGTLVAACVLAMCGCQLGESVSTGDTDGPRAGEERLANPRHRKVPPTDEPEPGGKWVVPEHLRELPKGVRRHRPIEAQGWTLYAELDGRHFNPGYPLGVGFYLLPPKGTGYQKSLPAEVTLSVMDPVGKHTFSYTLTFRPYPSLEEPKWYLAWVHNAFPKEKGSEISLFRHEGNLEVKGTLILGKRECFNFSRPTEVIYRWRDHKDFEK